jgi:hypothetical protein
MLTRTRLIAGAAVIAALAGGGSAVALATDSSANVYQSCLQHNNGTLYHVKLNASTPPRCRRDDKPISWNQTGPAGLRGAPGPAGAAGATGAPGQKGDPGPSDVYYNEVQNPTPDSFGNASVSLTLPAGNYAVSGKAYIFTQATVAQNTFCSVSGDGVHSDLSAATGQPSGTQTIALQTVQALSSTGTVTVTCRLSGGGATQQEPVNLAITAIAAGQIH